MQVRQAPSRATNKRRAEAIDELSVALVQHASLLTRFVFRHVRPEVSRSEASMLSALEGGPQRISTLAELEGLAQPTVTLLVKRLGERGLVSRGRTDTDGRVVVVSLTRDGKQAMEDVRRRYKALLSSRLDELPDEQIDALEAADGALAGLIDVLQELAE
jgi:DNA-binding MarR family transcriptional regulator